MKLLVVDSDRDNVEMLTTWLKTHGFEVQHAFSLERMKRLWVEHRPDLVITDTRVDNADAMALCRELRCSHDALVLAMPAQRDPEIETECLNAGADDYLPKPFGPRQMLAHIRALSRRVRSSLQRNPSTIIEVGPIKVNSMSHEVRTPAGATARLTPTESKVLHILAANANDICTLGQIVSHVWGYGDSGDTYLIKAHIRHLREKIEPDPSNPRFIVTVPGVGYSLKRLAYEPDADDLDIETLADLAPAMDMALDTETNLAAMADTAAPTADVETMPKAEIAGNITGVPKPDLKSDHSLPTPPRRQPAAKRIPALLDLGPGSPKLAY